MDETIYAFPLPFMDVPEGDQRGMTLRDWFASQAMAGLLAGEPKDTEYLATYVATRAYAIADAMLVERQK